MTSRRALKDRAARYLVALGGISVIIAIVLIFFYLLYVVIPMFGGAEMSHSDSYPAPGAGRTLHIGVEEQGTMAARFVDDGSVVFFDTADGSVVRRQQLELPAEITSVASQFDTVMLGLADGQALVVRYMFDISYPNDVRTLTPKLEYPLGDEPVTVDSTGRALDSIDFRIGDDIAAITALSSDNRLLYVRYALEQSFLSDSISLQMESEGAFELQQPISYLLLEPQLEYIYAASDDGRVMQFAVGSNGFEGIPLVHNIKHGITSFSFLLGGVSILIGLDNGEIQQWMPVRSDDGRPLTFIRGFHETEKGITALASEQRRKGFAAANRQGRVAVHYATSHRTLAHINTANASITDMAWSARAEHLLAVDRNEQVHVYEVHNEYPEISWSVLWGKVWYEGYDEPDYIWQSSASTNEFEPKLSLVPLSFGTIKAAFYAMLFAIPVAILGAIFTAQFMAPRMRQSVKPAIEIMEALPTVILGFLAGLWLAPLVEANLAGVFALLIVLPAGFLVCAWLWRYVPGRSRFEGWEAALLIPVVLVLVWLSMELNRPIEQLFFGGDLKVWLSETWGLSYDQRNSLVVGLIMGFAVIPTIFSIAEDALFSVPQHLIRGSLALGATQWQTLMRVVLPAASPGIFSALMMGFGRAVGETMIVLMATGNTPLMDMSIFQGMRTLSANIAVEVPESEVGSTHYRVLFLAALVLFLFTFVFNTGAEIVRQRLRKRYSAL